MGRFQLESIYRPVDNVVIATKGLQDRNTNIIPGTTVENKGKLILKKKKAEIKKLFFFLLMEIKLSY